MFRRPLPGPWSERRRLRIVNRILVRNGWPEGRVAGGLAVVPQMAKYRCLSPQVKREPLHLVYSMQIRGGGPQSPVFRLRKTPEGVIDAVFGPFPQPSGPGGGGVSSGYAWLGLVPMWESGVGLWMVWRTGNRGGGASDAFRYPLFFCRCRAWHCDGCVLFDNVATSQLRCMYTQAVPRLGKHHLSLEGTS